MNPPFRKLVSLAAVTAALSAAPAFAVDYGADWDLDADGALSQSEFADGFAKRGIFDAWDADRDGRLTEAEFSDGVYGTYDRDRSGDLDQNEYGMADAGAANYWGGDAVNYQAWDIDGDGVILSNEFADGWGEVGLFGQFDVDSDGALTEDEFSAGVYSQYDEDDTGIIEEPELADIGDDMGDEGFWDV